jgi:hypothetical protein
MASADADDVLAYADVSDLFKLVEANWSLFEFYLPPRERWIGRTDELRELRNRNAHCRRPHRDDVARIEQTLRDLEAGAWRFYQSYLDTYNIELPAKDPVPRAWRDGRHDVADRLLGHAERQYDVRFRLRASSRPWISVPAEPDRLSGREGVLWHATWILGDWEVRPLDLWEDIRAHPPLDDLIVHLLLDETRVTATFSALDDPTAIADAVGRLFETILEVGLRRRPSASFEDVERYAEERREEVADLPARVQALTPLTLIDPLNPPQFSIFGAY